MLSPRDSQLLLLFPPPPPPAPLLLFPFLPFLSFSFTIFFLQFFCQRCSDSCRWSLRRKRPVGVVVRARAVCPSQRRLGHSRRSSEILSRVPSTPPPRRKIPHISAINRTAVGLTPPQTITMLLKKFLTPLVIRLITPVP